MVCRHRHGAPLGIGQDAGADRPGRERSGSAGTLLSRSVSDRIAKGAEETLAKLVAAATDVNVTLRYGNRMYDELSATMAPATHQERLQRINAFETRIKQEIAPIRGGAGSLLAEYFLSSREEAAEVPAKVLIAAADSRP